MRNNFKPLLSVIVASVLLVAVVATNLQQVYAQIDPGNFVLWKKTTHAFEKNVINAIGNPDILHTEENY